MRSRARSRSTRIVLKTGGLDTVMNADELGRRHANDLIQPGLQIKRHRHETVYERAHQTPQPHVTGRNGLASDQPTVLGVDHSAARQSRDRRDIQRRQVVSVDQRRPQAPQQSPQAPVTRQILAFALAQREYRHLRRTDTLSKLAEVGQADHGMAVGAAAHAVDKIDQHGLHATVIQTMDHMDDQRQLIHISHRPCPEPYRPA